ncbi:DUF364 domain-containing protein [Caldivirga maquilingensis]|uniref:Heavy-metal chelation domain-containing protein n=1 Tax=Caldivirga maquilingensis (strain ATCC 700844 / DSM 13496 / JCM 10307 / IC-167) TaxID=397948 RepID=A8MB57_CALMQ|nr:DUF364 domain-containing protein [Caldivirga maquilingensis]ABW01147.1 protein of unknown function DUF364 [Caldivirga maquilingensis IC-167]
MPKSRVIEALISYAKENNTEVKNAVIGVSWTCVYSRYCGVSMTYRTGNASVRGFGHLEEMSVGELAEYLRSWNLLEASVGLAAVNSIIEPKGDAEVNGLDLALEYGKGKKVVMVGRFPGFTRFKEVAREVVVLELNPFLIDPVNGILPSTAAETVIEDSQVVVITASTIINKSIDRLLELAKRTNAYVILLGPSTPMLDLMFDFGIDLLAGVRVNNPYSFMKKISQGCGMISPERMEGDVSFIVKAR